MRGPRELEPHIGREMRAWQVEIEWGTMRKRSQGGVTADASASALAVGIRHTPAACKKDMKRPPIRPISAP